MMLGNDVFKGQVVSMKGFQDARKDSLLSQTEAYWEALRRGRPMPIRSEVDPRGIENALENAFIAERIAPQHARFRVAGSHLNDLMGMEVRGMPLHSIISLVSRTQLGEAIDKCLDDPSKVMLTLQAERGQNQAALSARLLLLPLKNDMDDPSRVLGCIVTKGRIGRHPRRFTISGIEHTSILSGAVSRTYGSNRSETAAPRSPASPGLQEAAAEFRHRPSPTAPYLRLVSDNDKT